MQPLKICEIEKAISGKIIRGNLDLKIENICTDSRETHEGDLFIPLKGEKHDAHKFIAEAVNNGAACVISDRELNMSCDAAIIETADTNKALQDLAHYYRTIFPHLKVIAITGSSGKTTTKDMLASILKKKYKIIKTRGNLNNYFGLPLTLLRLTGKEDIAILEMGMSKPGEIKLLTEIAKPDIGIITNVGSTHLEFLKSKDNVAQEKAELVAGLSEQGIAVLNYDNRYVCEMVNRFNGKKIISYAVNENADLMAKNIEINKNDFSTRFTLSFKNRKRKIEIFKTGKHNVYNALAAIGTARELKVSWQDIKEGLMSNNYSKLRQEIINIHDYIVINDTYNANPMSVRAALNVLQKIASKRKIAILGPMLELGEQKEKIHRDLGEYIAHNELDVLVTVGELGKQIAKGVRKGNSLIKIHEVENNQEALSLLLQIHKEGDTLLIKGSRGNKMEEIVDGLIEQGGC